FMELGVELEGTGLGPVETRGGVRGAWHWGVKGEPVLQIQHGLGWLAYSGSGVGGTETSSRTSPGALTKNLRPSWRRAMSVGAWPCRTSAAWVAWSSSSPT